MGSVRQHQLLYRQSWFYTATSASVARSASTSCSPTENNFSTLPLSKPTQRALKEAFGYTAMTETQARVLPIAFQENCDIVVRAKTGTGKTLSFLIPIVEQLIAAPGHGVGALVIAPTRELCIQITKEAEMLLTYHRGITVVSIVGGVDRRHDQVAIRRKKPRIMVATPGRVLDHLEKTFLFPTLVENLSMLVLDEADRLLDLGFLVAIKEVLSYLPVQRRSMLTSATISDQVLEITPRTCRGNYVFVDCIGGMEIPTHENVKQEYVICPGHDLLACLYNVLLGEMSANRFDYKILVFFSTARLTSFMAKLFREQLRIGVYEMHRRRDMATRLATQTRFEQDRTGIMFSSDVSARGVDYPNVSLVVQACAPITREQYIHRVGRTGRAGKGGHGVLLLGEGERSFLNAIDDLPIERRADQDVLRAQSEVLVQATTSWASNLALRAAAENAFTSLLVHYKSTHRTLHLSDDDIIQITSDLLLGCGLLDPPVISRQLAVSLGLQNHPQIRIATRLSEEDSFAQLAQATPDRPADDKPQTAAAEETKALKRLATFPHSRS